MALSDEGREAIQQSNRIRNMRCGKCGATSTEIVDGKHIGGFEGLQYRYCGGCGWSTPVKTRQQRSGLK